MRLFRPSVRLLALLPVAMASWSPVARADDAALTQCIVSSEQGLDLRKQEKLLDARKTLAACATTKCPDEIRTVCEQRIAEINGALPRVVFEVTDAAGSPLPGVKISVDGMAATMPPAGQSATYDPGLHTFRFEVAGQAPLEKKILLKEGDKDRRETVVMGAPSPAPVASPAPASPPPSAVASPGPAPAQPLAAGTDSSAQGTSSGGSTQKLLAYVAGGAGVVGLVVGSVFGLNASSDWSNAKSECGSGCSPASKAASDKSDAQSAATVSTIGFVAGGVLLATGAALYFTAPKAQTTGSLRVMPSVAPGEVGLFVAGGFR